MKEAIETALNGNISEVDFGTVSVSLMTATSHLGTFEQTAGRFFMAKSAPYVQGYDEITKGRSIKYVFELGIYRGGSVVFLDNMFDLQTLSAIDISTDRVPELDEYASSVRRTPNLFLHYGVDQSDKDALSEIVARDFPYGIDLVIDDASHQYGPSKASFEAVFPYVRPGGLYLIEDWSGQYPGSSLAGAEDHDCTKLLHEIIAFHASGGGAPEIKLQPGFFGVTRGAGHLPTNFLQSYSRPLPSSEAKQMPQSETAPAPKRRWGYDKPSHPEILSVYERHRDVFRDSLHAVAACRDILHDISFNEDPKNLNAPFWNNGYFSTLDAASLVAFILLKRPRRFVEIGSGNSTRFARYAIVRGGLSTQITSIDPEPRADIDSLCDRVVRATLQSCDEEIFGELEPGDILSFDGSHYVEPDSDVVVFFLEILPRLKPGIFVHIHDIFWPDDYSRRHPWAINEQYVLGVMLLADPLPFKIILPAYFVSKDPELADIMREVFAGRNGLPDLPPHYPNAPDLPGVSFWLETTKRP